MFQCDYIRTVRECFVLTLPKPPSRDDFKATAKCRRIPATLGRFWKYPGAALFLDRRSTES